MCGIAGRFAAEPLTPDRERRALALMANRGPDGSGVYRADAAAGRLTLLHTRLSIVDLAARSGQPFVKDGLALVFNGEIYNFPELRATLQADGAAFRTGGDTEVVLEAWRRWGEGALERFEGMFAFALWDEAAETLVLARDRFGEKPLYWMRGADGALVFASEIKVLAALTGERPRIDEDQLRRYLVNGYKGLLTVRRTFYADVRDFPPASLARIDRPHAPEPKTYWTLSYRPDQLMTAEQAIEGAREAVHRAIRMRLRADVPAAIRLSGGIDSNVIAGVAAGVHQHPVTCFSIVEDDPRYDETAAINATLRRLQLPSVQIPIPRENFLDRLDDMIAYFDGPPLTISYYLHWLVSEAIHDAGFKMALGGTGADELFTGYYDHYLFWLAAMRDAPDFERLVEGWRATYGRFVRNPELQDPCAFIREPDRRAHIFLGRERFSGYLRAPFDEPHAETRYADSPIRNRLLNELFHETVPVMLHDDDLAAMRWSVENRAAYLDRDLAEFLFTVPDRHLVQKGLPKYLLREAGRGLVDDAILDNPRKQGINAPVTSFVDFRDPAVRARLLDGGPLFDIVDKAAFEGLLDHDVALNSESKFLFSLTAAKLFLDQWAAWRP
ncbi:MAG: asparagine synthase (glutamine-hydrolyzing) [Marivibrio sp.]|uniref:asparagine synthase (glutamine-hydrolyzing) n=1 Tax=Marivibrio sp. TaxID=2039719 RepID=UPI0032EC2868